MCTPSHIPFEQEKNARDSWLFLAQAEEIFFRQKSRIRWLKEGDANTSFFHKSVIANLSRNIIYMLRDDVGIRVTNPLSLKNMVIQYYTDLLGVQNSAVQTYSVSQIQTIHRYHCPTTLSSQLSAIPTDEEIRATVFFFA